MLLSVAVVRGGHSEAITDPLFWSLFSHLGLLSVFSYLPLQVYLHIFIHVCTVFIMSSFSVARVSHDDKVKLSRDGRRSVTGCIQGNGDGGSSGRGAAAVD